MLKIFFHDFVQTFSYTLKYNNCQLSLPNIGNYKIGQKIIIKYSKIVIRLLCYRLGCVNKFGKEE